MSCTLSILDLTCHYDEQVVLDSLSLDVKKGEIVCLLGASGCGKTTLLKAIAGLIPLSQGSMSLNCQLFAGDNLCVPPEQRNIGMIFQDYALFPHLTVAENIAFGLKDESRSGKQKIVAEMLELVRLSGYGERYPHQLSGGQQQRVAIARSLACKPDLLLLDEPFSNIDNQVRHELIREIRRIFKSQRVTAIFVTHSREEAFAFADKMAVMNKGVIEQFGTASELYYQPSSKFVADFLGGGSYLPAKKGECNSYQTLFGEVKAQARENLQPGQECMLLLRPQHIQLKFSEESDIEVIELQFMGDHCRYVIDVSGNRLIATSSEPLSMGDKVSVELDQEGVLAFV